MKDFARHASNWVEEALMSGYRRAEHGPFGGTGFQNSLKIFDFFAHGSRNDGDRFEAMNIPRLETCMMEKFSETLRGLGRLREEDVRRWVEYWRGKQFV